VSRRAESMDRRLDARPEHVNEGHPSAAGTPEERTVAGAPWGTEDRGMQTKLSTEVRQSLSLLAMTAVTLIASIGLGVLAGRIG
jgi:hypothetical protein